MKQYGHSDQHVMQRVQKIVQEAGEILLLYFQKKPGELVKREKKDQGWVTEADLASEQFLKTALASVIPEASFDAEESGIKQNVSDYCWVIDPLDGTTNFVCGIPYFCISVALTYRDEPILGVIYQPITRELISAQKGQGLFLNGEKVSPRPQEQLDRAIIVVGVPYAKNIWFMKILDSIRAVTPHTYAFRHLGAVALDLAYVAIGRLDGVFLADLAWWDIAAGMLLVQEGGGMATDFEGNPLNKEYKTAVASGKNIHGELRAFAK